MKRQVKNNVSWVGYIDWELGNFHGGDIALEHGSSQNAYLIQEEKTVLIDTVFTPHTEDFVKNLKSEIDLQSIDYIIINHGERDHTGALVSLMKEIPNTPIFCTANCVKSLTGQYGDLGWNFHPVKTGNFIEIGNGKRLVFIEMKMLHWPDSMATYLTQDNILFSNDAFGQHYATESLFNDGADQELLLEESMGYYVNIVNQYSNLVLSKIDELTKFNLPIDMIAPSHGVIWRDNPMQIVEKYASWSGNYHEDIITIVYSTIWNGTAQIAQKIADEIHRLSPHTYVQLYNIEKTDRDKIMTSVFRSKAIAVGSPTISGRLMSSMAGWLEFLRQLKFKNKRAAAFGCYGWSGESVRIMKEKLREADLDVINEDARGNWGPDATTDASVQKLAASLLGLHLKDAETAAPAAGSDTAAPAPTPAVNSVPSAAPADNNSSATPAEAPATPASTPEINATPETNPAQSTATTPNAPEPSITPEQSATPAQNTPSAQTSTATATEAPAPTTAEATAPASASAQRYQCEVCDYTYDPEIGDPNAGIPAGTSFEDLPNDWVCPVCGSAKIAMTPLS